MIDGEQMTGARDMARLEAARPEIDEICTRAVSEIQGRAMSLIMQNKLTPEAAQSLWMELSAAVRFARRFQLKKDMIQNGAFNPNVRSAKIGD